MVVRYIKIRSYHYFGSEYHQKYSTLCVVTSHLSNLVLLIPDAPFERYTKDPEYTTLLYRTSILLSHLRLLFLIVIKSRVPPRIK
jgi:hypothetical protein